MNNEPTTFSLTRENLLDTLMTWMPDHMHKMRQYMAKEIRIGQGDFYLECQYQQTIGGEKFRIVNTSPFGPSGSIYYEPLGNDDDIILAFAQRIEQEFSSKERFGLIRKETPSTITIPMELI